MPQCQSLHAFIMYAFTFSSIWIPLDFSITGFGFEDRFEGNIMVILFKYLYL
jgi:hypothetical protein